MAQIFFHTSWTAPPEIVEALDALATELDVSRNKLINLAVKTLILESEGGAEAGEASDADS